MPGDTIAAAEAKGPEVRSAIEEAEGEKTQLDEDLKAHKADRETAKSSKAEAISIRTKQASEFAANKAEAESNTGALKKLGSAHRDFKFIVEFSSTKRGVTPRVPTQHVNPLTLWPNDPLTL